MNGPGRRKGLSPAAALAAVLAVVTAVLALVLAVAIPAGAASAASLAGPETRVRALSLAAHDHVRADAPVSADQHQGEPGSCPFYVSGARVAAEDTGSGAGRVFWTGGNAAKDAATSFAEQSGGQTLGMTPEGQAVEAATKDMPWSEAKPLWTAASERFAAGASGNADVFINVARANPDSIWAETELPALVDNPNVPDVNFHLIGW